MELEAHTVILLRWPDGMHEFEESELEALQLRHLAYLDSLRESGKLLVTGPLATGAADGCAELLE